MRCCRFGAGIVCFGALCFAAGVLIIVAVGAFFLWLGQGAVSCCCMCFLIGLLDVSEVVYVFKVER